MSRNFYGKDSKDFGLLPLNRPFENEKNARFYLHFTGKGVFRSFLTFPYLLALTPDVISKHIQQLQKAVLNFTDKPKAYTLRLIGALAGAGIGYTLGLSSLLLTAMLPISIILGTISLFNAYRKHDPMLAGKGVLIPAIWAAARFLPIISNLCSAIVCSNILYNTGKSATKWYTARQAEITNHDNAYVLHTVPKKEPTLPNDPQSKSVKLGR